MESANQDVNALHVAYCQATGHNLRLMPSFERGWLQAHQNGVTPSMLASVIKARQKRIWERVRQPESLYIRNLAGSEEAIAEVLQEHAAIEARARRKAYPQDKASVLRGTMRPDEPPTEGAKHIKDVLREIVNKP